MMVDRTGEGVAEVEEYYDADGAYEPIGPADILSM